jgi:hypothetical protein
VYRLSSLTLCLKFEGFASLTMMHMDVMALVDAEFLLIKKCVILIHTLVFWKGSFDSISFVIFQLCAVSES